MQFCIRICCFGIHDQQRHTSCDGQYQYPLFDQFNPGTGVFMFFTTCFPKTPTDQQSAFCSLITCTDLPFANINCPSSVHSYIDFAPACFLTALDIAIVFGIPLSTLYRLLP